MTIPNPKAKFARSKAGEKSGYSPNLNEFPASKNDPGTPLGPNEYWYFWVNTDPVTGKAIKGRTRKRHPFK